MPAPRATSAHLVGSVNLPSADAVFREVAQRLGDRAPRIPDGETGERFYWLQFQSFRLDATPGLQRVGDEPRLLRDRFDMRPFRLDGTVPAEDLAFPELGYAQAALDSFGRFAALQDEGVVPATTRFQVSLPTPAAVVSVFFVEEDRAAVEPAYTRALLAELDRICADVPHDRLSIQWDTAVEFSWLEAVPIRGRVAHPWWDDVLDGVLERAARLVAAVPDDVPVGFHLCYGDVEEAHFVQPTDAGHLADVIRGVLERAPRRPAYFHLPVPLGRDDEAYFAPLAGLSERVPLILGLVHHEDGVDGARRRMAAAASAVPEFGVATECGFGRGPEERTVPLLDLHRALLDA